MSKESKLFLTIEKKNDTIKESKESKRRCIFMNRVKINKVKAFREALNKSQYDMAILLNISQGTYSKKERQRKFSDNEKIILSNFFKETFPNETLESIFF